MVVRTTFRSLLKPEEEVVVECRMRRIPVMNEIDVE